MNAYDNLSIQYFYLGELDRSKYYNDRVCRGKFEANFSIVKKMSQDHIVKHVHQSKIMKGHFFGMISNIDHTLEMFMQQELNGNFSH